MEPVRSSIAIREIIRQLKAKSDLLAITRILTSMKNTVSDAKRAASAALRSHGFAPLRRPYLVRFLMRMLQREGAEQTEPIAWVPFVNVAPGYAPSVGRFHGHLRA